MKERKELTILTILVKTSFYIRSKRSLELLFREVRYFSGSTIQLFWWFSAADLLPKGAVLNHYKFVCLMARSRGNKRSYLSNLTCRVASLIHPMSNMFIKNVYKKLLTLFDAKNCFLFQICNPDIYLSELFLTSNYAVNYYTVL